MEAPGHVPSVPSPKSGTDGNRPTLLPIVHQQTELPSLTEFTRVSSRMVHNLQVSRQSVLQNLMACR